LNTTIKGALAGLAATFPLTLAMSKLDQAFPIREKQSFPPRKIVMWLSRILGIKKKMDKNEKTFLTMIGHFAYGALSGTLIKFLISRIPLVVGVPLLGLSVWILSYLGWLPVIKFDLSAFKMSSRKNLLMVIAHLVWGSSLALIYRGLDRKKLLPAFL